MQKEHVFINDDGILKDLYGMSKSQCEGIEIIWIIAAEVLNKKK